MRSKKNTVFILIAIAVVIVCIVFLWKDGKKKDDDEDKKSTKTEQVSSTSLTTAAKATTATKASTSVQSTTSIPKTTTATTASADSGNHSYTDNSSPNVKKNLDKNAFEKVSSDDDSYYFFVPTFIFNHAEKTDNGYYYNYGNSYILQVYTADDIDDEDPYEIACQDYDYYTDNFDYIVPGSTFKSSKTSNGFARMIIEGREHAGDDLTLYMICANDGDRHYYLKFYFDDPDITSTDDPIDYIVECIYRYCSFGGTDYYPRTYSQFQSGDMGTEK